MNADKLGLALRAGGQQRELLSPRGGNTELNALGKKAPLLSTRLRTLAADEGKLGLSGKAVAAKRLPGVNVERMPGVNALSTAEDASSLPGVTSFGGWIKSFGEHSSTDAGLPGGKTTASSVTVSP